MPIYEYLCESCGDKFEKLVRRTEDALEAGCPSCGEKHLAQQYSSFAARGSSSGDTSFTPAGTRGDGGCGSGMCGSGFCSRN
jgi:putative FmdB family regulatory protein